MVSDEQWDRAAKDLGLSRADLQERIDVMDGCPMTSTRHLDRQREAISLGQWAVLREAPSYRVVTSTALDRALQVIVSWHGLAANEFHMRPIFEVSVLYQRPGALPQEFNLLEFRRYRYEVEAIAGYDQLVCKWRNH